jgi:hypothetical protein
MLSNADRYAIKPASGIVPTDADDDRYPARGVEFWSILMEILLEWCLKSSLDPAIPKCQRTIN